jgi:protein-disulfide isomerase-like protein with CxxC motif
MTQAQAIKAARAIVGQIHSFGDAYTFNVLDEDANAMREGPRCRSFREAQRHRARAVARVALVKMGAAWFRADWLVEGRDGTAAEIVAATAGDILSQA